MQKILILTTNFWPEPTGISIYTTDLARTLPFDGYQVTVLTGLAHYPWWKVPEEFENIGEGKSTVDGTTVVRVRHFIPAKMNALNRVFYEISLCFNLLKVMKTFSEQKFVAVIAFIPAVAAGFVGKKIAQNLRIPFGVVVQDLSGVGARQSGLKGGHLFYAAARRVERKVIVAASTVVTVSPVMTKIISEFGVEPTGITHITNYAARTIELKDRLQSRLTFGWNEEAFIVVHSGNMGAKQGLENVIEASKVLSRDSKIKIYLVGHGNQEANLRKLCDGLKNIAVMGAVADDRYSALLSAADLMLVNERSTQMEMSLPSKLTSYLYSERPVLAAVPKGGATWKFLDGIAELVEAEKPSLLARAIEDLSQDPEKRRQLASKGLEFARKNLDAEIGRRKYLDWVNSLIESKRG